MVSPHQVRGWLSVERLSILPCQLDLPDLDLGPKVRRPSKRLYRRPPFGPSVVHMGYDPRLLRWFSRLEPAERLRVALEADDFLRQVRRDLDSRGAASAEPRPGPVSPHRRLRERPPRRAADDA